MVEIVTIFTSKPAGKLLFDVGDAVGTEARHILIRLERFNRIEALETLLTVVLVVFCVSTCEVGV